MAGHSEMPLGRGIFSTAIIAVTLAGTGITWAAGPVQSSHSGEASARAPARVLSAASDDRISLSSAQIAEVRASGLFPRSVRSLLKVPRRMNFGDYVWSEAGVPPGKIWVKVDLEKQLVSVFRGGHEIGTAVIMYGATEKQTPTGTFKILARFKKHESSIYDAPMPYTLRLTQDGVAIHGSDVRWGAATHGCIGVPVDFARELFDEARVGDEVFIAA